MSLEASSYNIVPEVPETYTRNLYEFIYRSFLLPQRHRFSDISRSTSSGVFSIDYSILDSSGNRKMRVHISGVYPINVDIQPLIEGISEEQILEAKEDVAVAVDMFEHLVRKNSLFFAWREGESVLPETVSNKGNKSLRRIFFGNSGNIYGSFHECRIIFVFISWTFGSYRPTCNPVCLPFLF